jgi:CheY-like chemotaxis protein
MNERPRILCLDDEPALLEGLERHFRKKYEIATSTSGQQALDLMLTRGPFAVVVSDMRMPGMSGAQFLARARELAPDTVRLLLTGHADMESAISAVNEGQIFRFLTKPCPAAQLQIHIDEAVKHYNLLNLERTMLEQTLRGAVKALTDVLALTSPLAFGRATRMRTRVAAMCQRLDLDESWQIEVAAMLSDLGAVMLPEETVKKYYAGAPLAEHERNTVAAMGRVGRHMIEDIPRLEPVLALLEEVENATLAGTTGKVSNLGAEILLLARDCDMLESIGVPLHHAIDQLQHRRDRYSDRALDALANASVAENIEQITLTEVLEGMKFARDVMAEDGLLIAPRGYEVNESFLARARAYPPGYVVEPLHIIRKS